MKNMKFILTSVLILSTQMAVASECKNPAFPAPRGTFWKECKRARANTEIDQFLLTNTGDLYGYINKIHQPCQITNNVNDFKSSQHPDDAAVLYFERSDDLYVLNETRAFQGQCPSMIKKVIMQRVKKWNVVSNTNTTIVNTALSEAGQFTAWDNVRPVYSEANVSDYVLNQNYGAKGKPFSSYVVFTLGYDHFVNKIEGRAKANYVFEYIPSKESNKQYYDLKEFKSDFRLQ